MGSVAAMQQAAKQIDQAGTGYPPARRWSLFNRETDTVVPRKEGDCSSVCAAMIRMGGYPIDLGYPSHTGVYTGNFVAAAMKAGFTAHRYTGLDGLRAGDFVVKPGAHVEFVFAPGTMFSAWMDENGQAHGGSPGDQTGKEVRFTRAFNYPGGWTTVVRPPADNNTPTTTPNPPITLAEGLEDMQIVTLTGDATQYLLGSDGTIIPLPNIEYAQVANAMVAKKLKGINKRQRDVLLDICRRMKEAR